MADCNVYVSVAFFNFDNKHVNYNRNISRGKSAVWRALGVKGGRLGYRKERYCISATNFTNLVTETFTVSLLSCLWAGKLYRLEIIHPPVRYVTAAVCRVTTNGTRY